MKGHNRRMLMRSTMPRRPIDSIGCDCGARTAVGFLDEDGKILFVGGSYKEGLTKVSQEPTNAAREKCLWCGAEWPKNVREFLKVGRP